MEFFSGGAENARSLFSRIDSHNLIRGNEDFVNFLGTEECQEVLQRDGISIHVPTGNIFINNQNTEESIYTFLDNQQDETKKEIPLDFSYDDNLTDYMTKYLPAINDYDEVKYDFLANKNSKFLFNLFNKYQQDRGRQKHPVRHTKVNADDYALKTLQDRNFKWDPNETFVQNRILATNRDFYYETGRFPGRNSLVPVPMANMPLFVNSRDWISPRSLYETYVGRDMQGLTSVQFLAAFNKFLGGDKEIPRNAMSEFFHNLSWQALTSENDSIKIEFTAITELVKSINLLLQKKNTPI